MDGLILSLQKTGNCRVSYAIQCGNENVGQKSGYHRLLKTTLLLNPLRS